jgi:hypothetical protein
MNAFEVVLVIVTVGALLFAAASYFRMRRVLDRLGNSPGAFAHPDDRPLSERPSEDEPDAPLPKRPLRGRG